MATVNFSVPDEVKQAFDAEFADQNKSAIIAELMRQAVRDAQLRRRQQQIFQQLTAGRARHPSATARQVAEARKSGRG